MKDIVPRDSRYIPIPQQPSCCVPACISMVMYRNNIPLIPQELLGYHLGLTVRPQNVHLYWNPRTGQRPPAGYGTQIYKPEYHPNAVFKNLTIPLYMEFHPVSGFSNAEEILKFLKSKTNSDADLLTCFNHKALNDSPHDGGHICVVDRVLDDDTKVRLIDPQIDEPKWSIVNISKLYKAMLVHGEDKMGGFWEFIRI